MEIKLKLSVEDVQNLDIDKVLGRVRKFYKSEREGMADLSERFNYTEHGIKKSGKKIPDYRVWLVVIENLMYEKSCRNSESKQTKRTK